jgi:hypothetical protein
MKKKFIPFEKLSKKKKKEINNKKRTVWKMNPITRCEERGYKRQKYKQIKEDD